MIEACSGPIRQTRPRAGAGGSTTRSGQSGCATFSVILTQAPPFRNRSRKRINWCYSLLNSFEPVDDNVTSQINPQPIPVTLLVLFALATEPAHLLYQPRHSSLNRQYSSLKRPGLPTPSTAMTLPILCLSKDGGGAWGDAGAIPSDGSVSNRPYDQYLGTHVVAPATPLVAAFFPPISAKPSSLPPPTSSLPKTLREPS